MEFGNAIDPAINARVHAFDRALAERPFPGLIEAAPTYRSLFILYDPLITAFADAAEWIEQLLAKAAARPGTGAPLKEVPTCYGGSFGPDLAPLAAAHGLSAEEVIRLHAGTEYRVYMLGFSPGFPYMGLVPDAIATPRLATPRTRVPAGSVGIAGRQTGVYAQSTPGGWNLIGRTPLTLFDPRADPPAYFAPGDRVRFVPAEPGVFQDRPPVPILPQPPSSSPHLLEILDPGFLTTVQDLGRFGYQRLGVPVSGAMDVLALRAANALVGNPPGAAALECTVAGPSVRFHGSALIALAGGDLRPVLDSPDLSGWPVPGWTSVFVRRGSILRFAGRRTGCRAYLAVAGAINVAPVLGSCSTYVTAALGGWQGRALAVGDALPAGPPGSDLAALAGGAVPEALRPAYSDRPTVRVVLGPQDDHFMARSIATFLAGEYAVGPTSDRMGCRLIGPQLTHLGAAEVISDGIAFGSVQVPPDGQPIVAMADRQTAGGYPKIATVISADLPLLAQCLPGQSAVRFEPVTVSEAQAILREGQRAGGQAR